MDHLHTVHGQALRQAMLEAQEALQKAQADHQSALAVMMDTDANVDGALALRRKGRAYAEALTAYANATMAWLAFVDLELGTVSKAPHRRLAAGS